MIGRSRVQCWVAPTGLFCCCWWGGGGGGGGLCAVFFFFFFFLGGGLEITLCGRRDVKIQELTSESKTRELPLQEQHEYGAII